jgi:lipopolysaccharide export system permease protein
MTLLSRYLLREHAKVLGGIFLVLSLLCFLFEFIERWDDVLEHDVPTRLGLLYLACKMPQFMLYVLPVSVLLSTFITLGLLGRSNELTAFKASGISGYLIAKPLIMTAALLSAFSFFWAETLVPSTNRQANRIWQMEVKKTAKRTLLRQNEIWFRSPSSQGMTLYRIGFMRLPETQLPGPRLERQPSRSLTLNDVTVLRVSRAFDLMERIDAREMIWELDHWVFLHGTLWRAEPSGDARVQRFERQIIPLGEKPEDFQWVEQDVEAMGFLDLLTYTQRAKEDGYDVTPQVTDLHFKLASSFFCVITVLFTIPLAMRIPPRAGGLALGVALSMAVGFIYYLFMALGLAFGHAGVIPPFLGAWAGNLFFGGSGLWWMLHLKH